MAGKKTIIATTAGVAAATGIAVAAKRHMDERKAATKASEKGAKSSSDKASSAQTTVYHVKPDGEEWVLEAEGASRATSRHGTKKESLQAGRTVAAGKAPSRLVIHRADGTIQRQHAYGLDD